jgi:hypothetical protein
VAVVQEVAAAEVAAEEEVVAGEVVAEEEAHQVDNPLPHRQPQRRPYLQTMGRED